MNVISVPNSPFRGLPHSDEYGAVVAYIGPLCRVVVDRSGYGWNVQTRAKRGSGVSWRTRAGFLKSRSNLASIVLNYLSPSYVAAEGITQEFINRTLEGTLPEKFTDEYGQKVVIEGGVRGLSWRLVAD